MANDVAVITIDQIERMGEYIAKSNLFGMRSKEQAIALMLIAASEGKHPASAAVEYNVIQNQPALKADAMLARFQAAGGSVKWNAYTDQQVSATFSHPQGGEVTVDWTMERAKAAGLGGKDNYKRWPRQMLRARTISEGVRTVYPGVVTGRYAPEEVADFDNKPGTPVKDMGPIRPVEAALQDSEPLSDEVQESLRELAALLVQMVEIDGNPSGAYMHLVEQNLDDQQKLQLWLLLGPNTKTRAALKKEAAVKAKDSRGEIANAVESLHSQPAAS